MTAAIAIAAFVAPLSASPADGDDEVIRVRGGSGWIATDVADPGTLTDEPRKPKASSAVRCSQHKSASAGGYATEAQLNSGAPATDGPGGWVVRTCSDGSIAMAWVPRVDPAARVEDLARRATNRLPLPLPSPRFNPARPSEAGPSTLVAIPTWFWLDPWRPVTQRTEAGSVWAEVIATPVAATWDPGDGSPVVRCAGPGTVWASDATSTRCQHTYVRSSAGEPRNVYLARVTVTWQVSWRGAGGRAGKLPLMERQRTFPIAVAERQTVVTVGGSR